MAMYETEAFWQNYMRRPKAQQALMEEQESLISEQVTKLKVGYEKETQEMKDAIQKCSHDLQPKLNRLSEKRIGSQLLYNALLQSKSSGTSFESIITEDIALKTQLDECIYPDSSYSETDEKQLEEEIKNHFEKVDESNKSEKIQFTKNRCWKDMPQDELADRLSKGEIIPRDEWIPGVSKSKRKLNSKEMEEYLQFGKQLNEEGKAAMAANKYERALTLFTQGVQLLNWIEATEEEDRQSLNSLYSMHLRNEALASLKLGSYQSAIKACTTILEDVDNHDAKALYRRATAYLQIGMTNEAKHDFQSIMQSPFIDCASKSSAKIGLQKLYKIVRKSDKKTNHLIHEVIDKSIFSDNRKNRNEAVDPNSAISKISNQKQPDVNGLSSRWNSNKESARKADNSGPSLNLEDTLNLLEVLLERYTSDEVQRELASFWKASDYEERRFFINSKRFLTKLQEPIFSKFGLNEGNHQTNLNMFQRSVYYWKQRNPAVGNLQSECWTALFGDCVD